MFILTVVVALVIWLANAIAWRELEYRSRAEIGGLPLVHVVIDFEAHSMSHATAVIALADEATGLIAIGGHATGFLAIGAIAVGGVAIGAIAVGPVALGAAALGLLALGAAAAGGLANGALAFGFAALGPIAIGRFAAGFIAIGQYRLTPHLQDRRARLFFRHYPAVLFRRLLGSAITNRQGVA
jgi:hypothetical protein